MRITPLLTLPLCLLALACTTEPTTTTTPETPTAQPALPAGPPQYESLLQLHQADIKWVDPEMDAQLASDHIGLLKKSLSKHDAIPIREYTCTFTKHETLRGRLRDPQAMRIKFRLEPFSVAAHWTLNPPLGDALIFVAGKWKDKEGRDQMLVRPKASLRWIAGQSVLRLPDGPDAMKSSAKPITMFGFANATRNVLEVYELAAGNGDLQQDFAGLTEVGGRPCVVIRRILPKKAGYPAWITETCLDQETLQPLRLVGYDWSGKLWADYMYTDIKLNPNLPENAFAPEANDIAPPK